MLEFSAKRKRKTILVDEIDPQTEQPNGRIKTSLQQRRLIRLPAAARAQRDGIIESQGIHLLRVVRALPSFPLSASSSASAASFSPNVQHYPNEPKN